MISTWLRGIGVALFLTLPAAAATAMTIDFESVPEGAAPQAHEVFVGDTYDVLGVDFYSKSDSHPRWNFNRYGNSGWFVIGGYQTPPYFPQTSQFGMRFATPVSAVSMDLFSLNQDIQFWAYDADGVYIPGVVAINPGGTWTTKTISAPEISNIVVQGTVNGYIVAMDNLSFTSTVPLPAALWLALPAVVAMIGLSRRAAGT